MNEPSRGSAAGTASALPAEAVRFGRFEVQPTQGRLLVDGEPAALGRRAFDLLLVLVERAGRLATRDELIERVWPGLVVEDNNLNVQVNALRRVLGANLVVTVPGRGYQLAARVEAAPLAAPPPPPVPALRAHLPAGQPPMFGRDDELAALQTLIDGHRLVTLVGAGGVGKSRLAQAALQQRLAKDAESVCWVDLTAAADATGLPGVVCTALSLQRPPGAPLDSLVQAAAGLDMLVALDNAETHLDAVAALTQALLDGVPGLRLVVTSQAPLRLGAERVMRLGPLAVPDRPLPAGQARRFGAIALFADRARAADNRFVLADAQLPAVAELCRRLDGLPLAIELAAARAPVMGIAVLLDSLSNRLGVLTSNRNRLAPHRQQTLRDALAWSYGLLSEREQQLFRRLAVLAGSASLGLVQRLVADPAAEATEAWAWLDALDQLVQRSLVEVVDDEAAGAPLYRLLESPRALALERLAAAGEEHAARQHHARAVLAELRQAEQSLQSGALGVEACRAQNQHRFADALQAFSWAAAAGEPTLALELGSLLVEALPAPMDAEERLVVETCESLLDGTADIEPILACRASMVVSVALGFIAPRRRLPAAMRALELARQHGVAGVDRHLMYSVLCSAALALTGTGPAGQAPAQALLEEALALEDPQWPPVRLRAGARVAAFLALRSGRADDALRLFRRGLALSQAAGDASLATRLNIADMELRSGDARAAVETGGALVATLVSMRATGLLALARINLAEAHLALGQAAPAQDLLQAAWPLSCSLGRQWAHHTTCVQRMAELAALQGRHEAAAQLLGAAEARRPEQDAGDAATEAAAARRIREQVIPAVGAERFESLRAQGRGLPDASLAALAFPGA